MRACAKFPRNWMPPDGLDRSRPREVDLTTGGKGLLTLAAILLAAGVVVAIGLGIVAAREAEEHRLLSEQGVDTSAVVTRLWRDSGESKQPWVAYRFTAGGHAYQGRAKARHSMWVRLSVGSSLPVRFVPSHSEINRPLGTQSKSTSLWVPYIVGAGFAAFGWLATLPVQISTGFLPKDAQRRASSRATRRPTRRPQCTMNSCC